MNDWSRLAVDPTTQKFALAKNELDEYIYAPDEAALGTPYQEAWAKQRASVGRRPKDNSVCP
jgi:hypothetical protein